MAGAGVWGSHVTSYPRAVKFPRGVSAGPPSRAFPLLGTWPRVFAVEPSPPASSPGCLTGAAGEGESQMVSSALPEGSQPLHAVPLPRGQLSAGKTLVWIHSPIHAFVHSHGTYCMQDGCRGGDPGETHRVSAFPGCLGSLQRREAHPLLR